MKKKLTALLSIMLVAVLATPAFAQIDLNGKMATQFEVKRDSATDKWVVDAKSGLEVETQLKAGGGRGVQATVKLDAIRAGGTFDDEGNPLDPITAPHPSSPMELKITEAYLETTGPFWHGGPGLYTRVGDLDIRWNPFVANLGRMRGIQVDGFDLGVANARAFIAWDNAARRHYGVQAFTWLDGIGFDATVVRTGGAHEAAIRAYADDLVPGMKLNGYVAMDADLDPLYRVNVAYQSAPGITLLAGYRGNRNFNGTFADADAYDAHTGFNVGMIAEHSGVKFTAGYDQPTSEVDVKAETKVEQVDVWAEAKLVSSNLQKIEIGAKRDLPIVEGLTIAGEYRGTIVPGSDPQHTLKASTRTDLIPQLKGLEVSGQVNLQGTKPVSWSADAAYQAPNGINFGAKYDSEEGPAFSAGLEARF